MSGITIKKESDPNSNGCTTVTFDAPITVFGHPAHMHGWKASIGRDGSILNVFPPSHIFKGRDGEEIRYPHVYSRDMVAIKGAISTSLDAELAKRAAQAIQKAAQPETPSTPATEQDDQTQEEPAHDADCPI